MSVVREACDSVTLLQDGRITRSGTLLDVIRDAGSTLSRELLPLPPTGATSGTVVEALLTDTPLRSALDAIEATAPGASVGAGSIETISGTPVGRLQVNLDGRAEADRLVDALRAQGIHAEVAA
ncbi:NIL domain-containing protein [Brevibacterium daeguense]